MNYYKVSIDMNIENDIVCHYNNDYGIEQNTMVSGKHFNDWDGRMEFYFNKEEGSVWTDYLANDKGWFLVSNKLKEILETLNTDIEIFGVNIREGGTSSYEMYYIANIVRVVDALCLEISDYFETKIEGFDTIYTVSKYGIYKDKVEASDIFKLGNGQEIPLFCSEKFKQLVEDNNLTGLAFTKIKSM